MRSQEMFILSTQRMSCRSDPILSTQRISCRSDPILSTQRISCSSDPILSTQRIRFSSDFFYIKNLQGRWSGSVDRRQKKGRQKGPVCSSSTLKQRFWRSKLRSILRSILRSTLDRPVGRLVGDQKKQEVAKIGSDRSWVHLFVSS